MIRTDDVNSPRHPSPTPTPSAAYWFKRGYDAGMEDARLLAGFAAEAKAGAR